MAGSTKYDVIDRNCFAEVLEGEGGKGEETTQGIGWDSG
jgi:hypothetical protein